MQRDKNQKEKTKGYANLPMYDFPHLQEATNAWWSALAGELKNQGFEEIPEKLTRDSSFEDQWRAQDLVLAQTCGYPLMFQLGDSVQVVGTPIYEAKGCEGPLYSSVIVVRKNVQAQSFSELAGLTLAVSSKNSHSGMNIIRYMTAASGHTSPFWGGKVISGGHVNSLRLLAEEKADVAAIDAITFSHLQDNDPELVKSVRILDFSPKAPGLPYITAGKYNAADISLMQNAIQKAMQNPDLEKVRRQLRLKGFAPLHRADYQIIVDMQTFAFQKGYQTFL